MPGQNTAGTQADPQQAAAQAAAQQDPNGAAAQQPAGAEPAAQAGGSADDLEHWKSSSRTWEDRSKANKAEADQAKAALAEANRQIAVMKTAAATGVSAEILGKMAGSTDEEIAANAALLAQAMAPAAQQDPNGTPAQQAQPGAANPAQPAATAAQANPYPDVPDFGASSAHATTKDEIEKIKDPTARVMARAGNVGLYQ